MSAVAALAFSFTVSRALASELLSAILVSGSFNILLIADSTAGEIVAALLFYLFSFLFSFSGFFSLFLLAVSLVYTFALSFLDELSSPFDESFFLFFISSSNSWIKLVGFSIS